MPWYQMPIPFQKQILCAIHSAQNGAVLTMGPLGDLDFVMAATVSIYTFHSLLTIYSVFISQTILFLIFFQFTRQIYKFTMVLVTRFK